MILERGPSERGGRELLRTVLWGRAGGGVERCRLERDGEGHRLDGVVLLPVDGVPVEARYVVTADAGWRSTAAHLVVIEPRGVRRTHLLFEDGRWVHDGVSRPELDGCLDVDLGLTPSTNTLPVRRLGLPVGGSAAITAAWLRFPTLDVVPAEQRYTRLAERLWRYESATFTAELGVDDLGVVLEYGGVWSSIAVR